MSIKIVTDSTCDLPAELVSQNSISVVPLYINIGDKGYLDKIEITRQEFYTNLPNYAVHPTTGTPGPDAFKKVYQRLASEGATQILSIHISESLSATINSARQAAEETKEIPVTVLDSGQLSLGVGFSVLAAARAAAEGRSMEEILEIVEEQGRRTYVFAALDTLEFLRRSGRMNGAITGIGSLLKLKPILKMNQGHPTSERVRTTQKAQRKVITLLEELAPFEKAALVHANAPQTAEILRQMAGSLLPEGEILSMDITPAIGAHIGPGAAGFAVIAARKPN